MIDEEYTIECEECGWSGLPEELHCSDEDMLSGKGSENIKFDLCPTCESKNIVDID